MWRKSFEVSDTNSPAGEVGKSIWYFFVICHTFCFDFVFACVKLCNLKIGAVSNWADS